MPLPRGKLFVLALERISGILATPLLSNSDHLIVSPFPPDFHDDTSYSQVIANNYANNNTVTVYQVTSGKVLYWQSFVMSYLSNGGGAYTGQIYITSSADVVINTWQFHVFSAGGSAFSNNFHIPLKVTSLQKIRIKTDNAGLGLDCTIVGYEK